MQRSDQEARRRAIEVVLERRPDIDLAELGEILAELGSPADEATLVADLDALGYEVDPPEDGAEAPAPPVEDRPGPRGRAADGGPRFVPPDDDAFAGAPPREGGPRLRGANPTVLVAAGVLVVALVVAAVLALGGDDAGDDGGDGDDVVAVSTNPTSTTAPEATLGEDPRVAARGDGLDPALAGEGVVLDDFERPGPDLGEVPGVGPWEVLAGDWAIEEGQVTGAGAESEPGNLVAFDPGSADVRMQVELRGRTNGSGIAFRVADVDNYWAWVTAPEFGTIGLVEVADGERRTVFDAGLAVTEDGMPALGINLTGTQVELLFDGAVAATYDQLPPAEGRQRVGLTMARGDEVAIFDDVRLLVPG